MCCFSRPVLSVVGTNIFARLSGNGSQYLVYEMTFVSEEPNAIILPIPVRLPATEDCIKFIDLSTYPNFFKRLVSAFPAIGGGGIGCAAETKAPARTNSKIEVHKVGNFVASFVPSSSDFDRLDPQFSIPKATWDLVPEYSNYGFVVFQLDELSGKPHPMAFEFKYRDEAVFFPTFHIHDGEVHRQEEFDHRLFLQHASFDGKVGSYRGPNVRDSATNFVRSKDVAGNYFRKNATKEIINPELLIHRIDLYGQLKNQDMIYNIAGHPLKPGLNLRKLQWIWPWAAVLGGFAWFFNRKNRISKSRLVSEKQDEISNQ
jgi:hypothetical protein